MPTPIFISTCSRCSKANEYVVCLLGAKVSCPECLHVYTARDREMESAALEEEVGSYARIVEWSLDVSVPARPR